MAGEEFVVAILMGSFMAIIPMTLLVLFGLPEILNKVKLKFFGRWKGYGTLIVAGKDRTFKKVVTPMKDLTKIEKGNRVWNVRASCVGAGEYGRPEMIVPAEGSEPFNVFEVKKEGKDPATYGEQLRRANFIGRKEEVKAAKKTNMYLMIAMGAACAAAFLIFDLTTRLELLTTCLSNPACAVALLGV